LKTPLSIICSTVKMAYGLLAQSNGELQMLSVSKKYRQQIGFGSKVGFLQERYGQAVCDSWYESMQNESGWTGHIFLDNQWHKVELWNHGQFSLLFECPLNTDQLSGSPDYRARVSLTSEEQPQQPTESIGSFLLQIDNHGKIIRLNEPLCTFFAQTNDQMKGLDAAHLVFINDMGHYKRLFNTISFKHAMCDGSFSLRNAQGHVHRFDWTAVCDGRQIIMIGKSSHKHLEDALVKSEERLNNILETMNEAFFAIDNQGYITYINTKGAELLGRPSGSLLGRLLSERAPVLKSTPLLEHLDHSRALKENEIFQWEDTQTGKWYQVKACPGDDLISVFFSDISDLKKTESNARHQAMHDSLTGLPNRLSLKQTLSELMDDENVVNITMGVLFIDLDGFKSINDTLGHNAGDQLLQLVSIRLRDSVRSSDVVARLSGDEFVIMLPYINGPEDAFNAGKKWSSKSAELLSSLIKRKFT
jgi:PAS domain S-box-containing protein